MMREKSLGQAAIMGSEWEPAGVVSRKIAERLNNVSVPLPQQRRIVTERPGANDSVAASPRTSTGRAQAGGSSAFGPPAPYAHGQSHKVDWQMMSRASPHRSKSSSALVASASRLVGADVRTSDEAAQRCTGRPGAIAADNLPR